MFGLGVPELLIIGIVLLLIFGLGRLPRVAGQLGSSFRAFRDSVQGEVDDIEIGDTDDRDPAQLEDKKPSEAVRDASMPQQQETGKPSADGKAL